MNPTDTPTMPAGAGAGAGLGNAQELRTPASGVPTPSTNAESHLTSPSVVARDSASYKRREENLRITGEILHERCVEKLERLNQVQQAEDAWTFSWKKVLKQLTRLGLTDAFIYGGSCCSCDRKLPRSSSLQ